MLELLENKLITRGKFEISYCDLGPKNAPAIVLCHGLASSGQQFSQDAMFFVQKGYRVILPDLRGHGRSNIPHAISQDDFSINNMAQDLIAIFDDAGVSKLHYVGNSLGGILALSLLSPRFERFKSFATFGTSYALSAPSIAADALPTLFNLVDQNWIDQVLAFSTSNDRSVQKIVRQLLRDYHPDAVSYIAKNVSQYDFIQQAASFNKPIAMLRGGQDRLVNAALGKTINEMKTHANFICFDIEKGGHCLNLDASAEFRTALLGIVAMHEFERA